jgi:hypothetical protein
MRPSFYYYNSTTTTLRNLPTDLLPRVPQPEHVAVGKEQRAKSAVSKPPAQCSTRRKPLLDCRSGANCTVHSQENHCVH